MPSGAPPSGVEWRDEDLGNATTFAVTVEQERVETPTSAPVLVGSLES